MENRGNEVVVSEQKEVVSLKKEMFGWLKVILLAMILGMSISYFVKPTWVSGESMFPTLQDSDYLLLNRVAYKFGKPQHKDIVVFHSQLPGERILIKRVIATEGEKIEVKDGKVYVNDTLIDEESYLHGSITPMNFEGVVPQGKMFVMGDNRWNSLDSRYAQVGFVSVDDVIGKVMFRAFPMKAIED